MIKKSYQIFFHSLARVFVILLLAVFVLNLVLPDRGFSEKENRVLSSFPKLTAAQVLSGKAGEKIETYANDQFVGRDLWVELKANMDLLLGKVESHDVYLGKKGYLLMGFKAPSEQQLNATTEAMTSFAERHSNLKQYAMIVPTAANILSDYMPKAAPVKNENKYLNRLEESLTDAGISWIDTRETMKSHREDVQLYYRTDHHWTTAAAYYAYMLASNIMDLDTSQVNFEQQLVTKNFQGTLSAKSGFRSREKESIYVFLPTAETAKEYYVNYLDEQKRVGSLYSTEKLGTRDKYGMFLNGNHAQVEIVTPEAEDRTLLVLKDSYANCFLPFLQPYYRHILVVDPRYYYGNLDNLIAAENVQEILYLYNANTFFSDTSLQMALGEQ